MLSLLSSNSQSKNQNTLSRLGCFKFSHKALVEALVEALFEALFEAHFEVHSSSLMLASAF